MNLKLFYLVDIFHGDIFETSILIKSISEKFTVQVYVLFDIIENTSNPAHKLVIGLQ